MAIAPDFLTWEGNGDDESPRRPSTDDLGGDEKQDDLDYPPDDVEHPTAAGHNQGVKQLSAMARVVSSSKIEVRFNAGAPYIARVAAPSGNVTAATFDVTDEGTGVTTIEWPAGTFPPFECSPTGLTVFSSSSSRCEGHMEEITNGVRVRTFTNGSAADLTFTFSTN